MHVKPIDPIRNELCGRIAAIEARAGFVSAGQIACEVDAIRSVAHRHGFTPAVTVAHLLSAALSRGEQGALVHGWLAVLHDAVGCERHDAQACDAYAAVCSVRLSS